MNKIVLQLFVLCLVFWRFEVLASTVPQMQHAESIRISAINSGWNVSVMPDGSGSIGFGSNPMDIASFPKGTMSFQDIYNTLVPRLKETSAEGDIAVTIRTAGEVSTTARYIDPSAVRQIFAEAQQHSTALDKARFDALVRDHPIESNGK